MVNRTKNKESISEDEAAVELNRLREAAQLAAIYHSAEREFRRRTDLSHVVHASLHFVQFVFTSATESFHHIHHYLNKLAREKDDTVPALPEERNPIFFLYPFCMVASLLLAILWLTRKILLDRPLIPLAACATAAILMLTTGIMEMKHADTYIDLTKFTDEELLEHPIFIHNFVMCILSIFVMTIYLIQTWILFDYWQWLREEEDTSSSTDDTQSDSSPESDVTENSTEKIDEQEFERQLAPIPTFQELSIPVVIPDIIDMDDEPVIYCCFVDWYNYIKMTMRGKPKHEFQVVHVM